MSFFSIMSLLDGAYDNPETQWSGSKISEIKQRCDPAVVAINLVHVRKVGIEGAASIARATGFVVSAENGLILTNRHVIKNGPVIATGTFSKRKSREKVKLVPLYRDPVHDFGFFRFDPADLDISSDPLVEIALCPSKAVKNARVLICGYQRGRLEYHENVKLLDVRVNPVSGMDFNSFMITGDDETVPGYSGGPILNAHGEAVAMVSTTLRATKLSYHVPLDRCKYTLDCLVQGHHVPRGTLQAAFSFRDEAHVQGLTESNLAIADFFREQAVKDRGSVDGEEGETLRDEAVEEKPEVSGLLQVDIALAGGSGEIAGLRKGDWLLSINDAAVASFVEMEEILDGAVGKTVDLAVVRGEEVMRLKTDVQDFHELDPSEYIEVSNAIVHHVEFITAMVYKIAMEGVFVAQAGYMFRDVVPDMSVVTMIGDKTTRNLDEFQQAIDAYTNGSLVRVQFFLPTDPERVRFRMLQIEKQWFAYQRGVRDATTGQWDLTDCKTGHALRGETAETRVSVYTAMTYDSEDLGEQFHPRVMTSVRKERGFFKSALRGLSMSFTGGNGRFKELHNAVVSIKFTSPFVVDSMQQDEASKGRCVGVVVDKELGLVLTERFTVFTTLGDALITFNSIVSIAARVVFVHPLHLYSILQYDPTELVGHDIVRVNALPLAENRVEMGENVLYAGLSIKYTRSLDPTCTIGAKESLFLSGAARDVSFTPRNLEYFQGTERSIGMGGAYIDPADFTLRGLKVHFINMKIQGGIQAADVFPYYHLVRDAILRNQRPPKHIPLLGVHLDTMPLVELLNTCDLSKQWTRRLYESMGVAQHSLLVVSKRMLFTSAHELLRNQDVILAVNDKVTTNLTEFNAQTMGVNDVAVTVIRDGEVITVENVQTTRVTCVGTTRLVFIAGMTVQRLPPSAFFALDSRDDGVSLTSVYITSVADGSPGKVARCHPSSVVIEVDGVSVKSMDEFLEQTVQAADGETVTLKLLEIESGSVVNKQLIINTDFWPTRELIRNGRTLEWRTTELEHGS